MDDLLVAMESALARVILRHPPLCCGIINEDKDDPSFVRLESIDVSKCIDYRLLNSSVQEEHEQSLIEIIQNQHCLPWTDMHCRPVWKLIIVQSKALAPERTVFDAIFAWHHGIADGISGMVFHRSMQEALNDSATVAMDHHMIKVPESISLFPPQEAMIEFKISWWYFLTSVWHFLRPKWLFPDSSPPWTGPPVPTNTENFDPRVQLISLPSKDVNSILSSCREQKTTLTGLFEALVVSSLAHRVPNANNFVSNTSISPRSLSGISSTSDMAVQVCSHKSAYNSDIVSAIRAASTPAQATDQVWGVARDFRASLASEMAQMPNDNPAGLLPYAGNIRNFFRSKLGKPREDTFQISNVGTLKNEVGEGKWKIERIFFTQCGMAGSVFSFNVASVGGGPLSITFTWQADIANNFMGNLIADVHHSLKCIADGREISLGHSR
jgi:Alcohol acetyltransferase